MLKEGETYTLSVLSDATGSTSALPIAITELFDSTKTSITAADGRFTDGNATLAFKAESDGEYYLAARGYRGQTGNYTLSLSEGNQADDAGLVPSKSRVLTVNEQETGLLEVTGDRDLFAVDVLENHTYRFRLSPEYNGIQAPLIDPRLRLLGDTQTFIKAAGYDFIANSITVKSDSVIVSDSNNTAVSNPYQNPYQSILVSQSDITTSLDGNVKIPLQYDISDKNNAVTGLGLQIHYNSSAVNPTGDITSGLTGLFSTNIFGTPSIIDDSNNLDSDDDTDDDIDESCAPDLYQRCRTQLLGLLPAIARSIHGQVGWHAGTSSHRASYVNALRDLLTELGADASGKIDGTGAASAQATVRCL